MSKRRANKKEEQQYLNILEDILSEGYKKPCASGNEEHDTYSLHGVKMEYSLMSNGKRILPLLTSKRVSFRLVLSELLWFLSGSTSAKELVEKYNNHIWDANADEDGELGPIYGHQWRSWNAPFEEYDEQSQSQSSEISISVSEESECEYIDQIETAIAGLKADIESKTFSRRHVVSAWNPEQLEEMVLPPCHVLFHFLLRPDRDSGSPILDCLLYQRSGDFPLGVPFNIASYSLLTHMISQIINATPGKFIHFIGDAHIYQNQIPGCKMQLEKSIGRFPVLNMKRRINIDDFVFDDFEISGYKHAGTIDFPLNV